MTEARRSRAVATSRWHRLGSRIPLISQLRQGYGAASARADVLAGLTTAVLLVPQATAYALLAGLPPAVGLFASTLPLLVYALFGSSPHLSVGPVALVSVVVSSSLSEFATPGSEEYLVYAAQLALVAGALQLSMGALRFGFIADLLSRPVMTGFSAAAALLIIASQLGAVTGIEFQSSTQDLGSLELELFRRAGEVHLPTLATALASIAGLVLLQMRWPRLPRALIVLAVIAAFVTWAGPGGVEMVGDVPSGLPEIAFPALSGTRAFELLPSAGVVLFVGFVEAYAIARITARDAGDDVSADRELAGLGAANLSAGLVGAYPIGGAFSRTAVQARAGARTNVASLVACLVVVATLLYFTPVFRYLPRPALAGVIIVAVSGLIDVKGVGKFWTVDRRDFLLAALTFATTLGYGVRAGILLGVGASLLSFFARVARPKVVRLRRMKRASSESGAQPTYPERAAPQAIWQGALVLKVQAPVFFANARYLQERIFEYLEQSEEVAHTVIVDASAIDHLDASAELALRELIVELERRKVVLRLACVTDEARGLLRRSGLLAELSGRVHVDVEEALNASSLPRSA